MTNSTKSDFIDQLQIGIDALSSIICEHKKKENIEIELRLGQIQYDGFNSGLNSKEFFNKIKSVLDSGESWSKKTNNKSEELCHNGIRRTIKFNNKKVMKHDCIKKERILNNDFQYYGTPYDVRISVSKEIPVEDKIKSNVGILRKKNRFSYYYKDYRVDLTEVEQINNQVSGINYELEVEFMNLKNKVSDKYRAHSGLLLIRDIINMCEEISKDSKLIKPVEEVEEVEEVEK
jgi:hypothetical protein